MRATLFLRTFALLLASDGLDDALAAAGPVRVSDDRRHLARADGTPFFWLGDTAWELFHRLTVEEADRYLRNRAEKGFTVIQCVLLAELDGLRTPNANGDVPLHDLDPAQPNEAYFAHVDRVVARANELGLTLALLPTWGDKFNLQSWGVGPLVFTPDNARIYGEWVGRRYAKADVVWVLGGDRRPDEPEDFAIIEAMATGVRAAVGRTQLITYHPAGGSSSSRWWHEHAWLDFNLFQSGHSAADNLNFQVTLADRARVPVKPVIDGEPNYEDHPIAWKPVELGWFTDFEVRRAAWWSMLSGAAGHTYGHHAVWQMWQAGREPVGHVRTPWQEALDYPGAFQMGVMRRVLDNLPWATLEPRHEIVAPDERPPEASILAAAAPAPADAGVACVIAYSPYGYAFTLDLSGFGDRGASARWVDPRTGHAISLASPPREAAARGAVAFDPPQSPARGNDWVLVITSP